MTISRIPDRQATKSRIPCPNVGESRFPNSSQIPNPVKIFCVFPNPAQYFGQIPDPENTLPDPVKRLGRSVHFYPAFEIIFSLPVCLYRRDLLQQNDQILALKVSRNHSQNSLNSTTRNNYELATFSRALFLPPPLVFVRALQTVPCQPT